MVKWCGASLSEPHTNVTALCTCVCMFADLSRSTFKSLILLLVNVEHCGGEPEQFKLIQEYYVTDE